MKAMIVPLIVGLLAMGFAAPALFAPGSTAALRIRATEAMAPCAAAAARAFAATGGPRATLETGDLDDATADVLLGSGVEITRALESGLGRDDSDVAIAEIPWVLVLADHAPAVSSLDEAVRAGLAVEVLAGPAAYEARRALSSKTTRVHESRDLAALRKAEAGLVPLSLAGAGRRIAVDVPALVAQAAVGARAQSPEAALRFVTFVGGDAGKRAFSECGVSGR
jgi:hypothetical protein